MQTTCTIRALSDPSRLSTTEGVILCYREMIDRMRVAREEYFARLIDVVGRIEMESNSDVSSEGISDEFLHRTWNSMCMIEGRTFYVENLFDVVQGSVIEENENLGGLPFYWVLSSDLRADDLGTNYKINIKIGPFWSDDENRLVLSAAVILMEDKTSSLMRRVFGTTPDEDDDSEEEPLRFEILEEVTSMISGTIEHLVNPYDDEDDDDDGFNDDD